MTTSVFDDNNEEVLKAIVITDRFHVAKIAGEAMEKARKATRIELTDKERKKLKDDRKILLKRRDNIKSLNELASLISGLMNILPSWRFITLKKAS